MDNLEVLQVWEAWGESVESILEDFVHLWGTADPQLLASLWKTLSQEALIPTSALLIGETEDKLEVLGLKGLEELEELETAGLLSVEVGHVEGELEVVSDHGLLLLVHLTHNEASNEGGQIHEGDGTSTSTKSEVLTGSLHTEGLTHWTLAHELGTVTGHGSLEHAGRETTGIPVSLESQGEVVGRGHRVERLIKADELLVATFTVADVGLKSLAHVGILILSHNI